MVFGYLKILTGGAGFAAGTGLYRLSLPSITVTPQIASLTVPVAVGKAVLYDADNVATSSNMTIMYESAINLFTFRKSDGNYWRENTPITLAQNDRMSGYFMLPTSSA